jgi:hypothetical protein
MRRLLLLTSALCLLSSVSALAAEPSPDFFAYDKSTPLNIQEAGRGRINGAD